MPRIDQMLESKFLKQSDVGPGVLMTVKSCEQHNVAKQGAEPEFKWCLTFREEEKPLVLNSTNIQLCKAVFDSDDTDNWIGKPVVLYTDPTVMYAGKVVGGIRIRKPKPGAVKTAPVVAQVAAGPELTDDDIPF